MKLYKYQEIIKGRMGDKRFIHSVNVSEEAGILAQIYGADVEKARVAGMLHDVTKETPFDEQLKIITKGDIILDEVEKDTPKLWHPISGSVFIRTQLDIDDMEIVNAVRYHTTGRENATLLDKIIFVADFTSAERNYDDVEVIRKLSRENIDKAVLYGLQFTISDLSNRCMTIHPNAVALYNELLLKGIEI